MLRVSFLKDTSRLSQVRDVYTALTCLRSRGRQLRRCWINQLYCVLSVLSLAFQVFAVMSVQDTDLSLCQLDPGKGGLLLH